jgi:hypothetical protein
MPDEDKVQEALGTGWTLKILTTGGWLSIFYIDRVKYEKAVNWARDIINMNENSRTDIGTFGKYLIKYAHIIAMETPEDVAQR